MTHPKIPWPADPATFERDDDSGDLIVGRFLVGHGIGEGWFYYDPETGESLGDNYETEYDAVNKGALRDDYRGDGSVDTSSTDAT